jgi:dTDP-4-amino-4,6-dideoxygalactose transaminase
MTKARRKVPIALPATGVEEWEAVRGPIEQGWLTQGPKVAEFEQAFAKRHDVAHGIATTSCTTAMQLMLAALDLGPGDEVVIPAFTWVATANVVILQGATPVFADVDPRTFNLTPETVAPCLSPRTRAILAVHLFGLCADIEGIAAVAPGSAMLEDAACAVGARVRGRSAGALGLAGAFSFHPRKVVTTGEGGMVTTSDAALAERLTRLRNHGASVSEEQRHRGPQPYLMPAFDEVGYNFRMTDLQGAIGLVQLAKLDRFLEERRHWANRYAEGLGDVAWLALPTVPDGYEHGFQSYVCRVHPEEAPAPRNELMERLEALGVATRPGTVSLVEQGAYQSRFELSPGDAPHATECARNTLALPMHNRLSESDCAYVIDAVRSLAK